VEFDSGMTDSITGTSGGIVAAKVSKLITIFAKRPVESPMVGGADALVLKMVVMLRVGA
jgi:hypothetical protein